MNGHLTFLSWVRDGAAAYIAQPETLSADLPGRATVPVRLDIESVPARPTDPEPVAMALRVYGPGDVLSLDWDEIVRVDPPPDSVGFGPNYVPVVEFRRPDLPWLFSPVAGSATSRHKLRPWLCLVVVPQDAAVLEPGTRGALPRLRCNVRELPEPDETWAWAHAQIVNLSANESISTVLRNQPERAVSRLIGARRLESGRRYCACLVPTFKAGVEAALSEKVTTATLAPAWSQATNAEIDVELPVYYHWRFTTGLAGDFEALVRRLTPCAHDGAAAVRPLDVSDPGGGVITREPGDPPERLPLAGAFAAVGHRDDPWHTAAGQRFETELRQKFDAQASAATTVVGPPLYGRWHAGVNRPPAAGQQPHWLRDLNLDPRMRAYAGLGVATVQRHQDALMASAWEQLDEIATVNQALRQAQLTREVCNAVQQRRLDRLRPATLLQVTRNAHGEMSYQGQSLRDAITRSDAPDAVATSVLRRVSRPRGPLVRRSAHFNVNNAVDPHAFVQQAATGGAAIDTRPTMATGAVFFDDLGSRPAGLAQGTKTFQDTAIRSQQIVYRKPAVASRFSTWTTGSVSQDRRITSDLAYEKAFTAAITLIDRQAFLFKALRQIAQTFPVGPGVFLSELDLAGRIGEELAPDVTVAAGMQARIESDVAADGESLEPILAAPSFPTPMVDVLRDMAPEFLLTGTEGIPPESVSLVRVNDAFVHAYLIGLNHGMAAELLWRGYPTDQRGTYFRRFWDRSGENRGALPGQPSDGHGPVDIPLLHQLPPSLQLIGTDAAATAGGRLTLLIRGELVRRYSGVWIYATPAVVVAGLRKPTADRTRDREPVFSGRLGADAAYFAFDLTPAEARGDVTNPGWFIVFREPPTEVRFGLDEPVQAAEVPASLDNLAWNHVLKPGDAYATTKAILGTRTFTERVDADVATAAPVTWAANGAHMARCFMQWPVSVALHAEALMPQITAQVTSEDTVEVTV